MILDPSDLTFVLQDIVRQKMVDVVIGCLHSICDDVIDVGRVPAFSRTITFRPKWAKSQNVLSQLRFVSLFRVFFKGGSGGQWLERAWVRIPLEILVFFACIVKASVIFFQPQTSPAQLFRLLISDKNT